MRDSDLIELCGSRRNRADPNFVSKFLAGAASAWLRWGGVGSELRCGRSGGLWFVLNPSVGVWLPNLFGGLAVRLAFDLIAAKSVAWCAECNHQFPLEPNASPARDGFCPNCRGVQVCNKHAAQRRRDRVRQARLLASRGRSTAEIVEELKRAGWQARGDAEVTIGRWLGPQ